MNHPDREELAEFLYEELAPGRRGEIAQHVEACADCRAQVAGWRGVRQELRAWQLPEPRRAAAPPRRAVPWALALRWAAAAVVLAGLGFIAARLTTPAAPDVAPLRAELARELRSELKRELQSEFAQFAADQSARRRESLEALTQAIGRLETQRLVDYASLRTAVETVAVHAQDEFLATRQNLYHLAAADVPSANTRPRN